MKVATKLRAAFAVHIMIVGAVLLYHAQTIRGAVATGRELADISGRVTLTSTQQVARLAELGDNAEKYGVTRDPRYLARFDEVYTAHDAALRSLAAAPRSGPERDAIVLLCAAWAQFTETAGQLRHAAADAPRGRAPALIARLQATLDTLRFRTQRVSAAAQAAMFARLERSALAARGAERASWLAAAAALLLSVLVSAVIVRSISERLDRLAQGTREVAQGRFDYRLTGDRGDEFAQVARDFNTMTVRLGELDQMKRDFVSRVSHDLKTPLASMLETIDVLLDEVPGPLREPQRRLLALNRQSGQRLASMLAKLLDLSRLEAGPELRVELHDVASVAERAVAHAAATQTEHDVRVTIRPTHGRPFLECDPDRLQQLCENLLENAIKFSPLGGEIRIAVAVLAARPESIPPGCWPPTPPRHAPSPTLHLAVADRGPGVPDHEKQRIFDRFYQTEAGRAVRGRGVGLGLTICRDIAAAHHGTIWVTDNPGGGSVFHVLLPGAIWVSGDALAAPRPRSASRSAPAT